MANSTQSIAGGASAGMGLAGLALAPATGGASLGVSTALSAGGAGLGALSSILTGQGTSSADTYKAEQLQREAEYGELKATQTGGQMTRSLNQTLGTLDAVRAAAHTDPTSPTGAAVRSQKENIGMEQEGILTSSIRAQSQEDVANAAYLRSAASASMLSGEIGAGGSLLKSLSGAFRSGVGAGGSPLGQGGIGMM